MNLPQMPNTVEDALLQLGHILKTAKQIPALLPRPKGETNVLPRVQLSQYRSKLENDDVGIVEKLRQPRYKRNQLTRHKYPLRSGFSTAAAAIMQQELFKPIINHIYDSNGNRQTLRKLLAGVDKERWKKCVSIEIG